VRAALEGHAHEPVQLREEQVRRDVVRVAAALSQRRLGDHAVLAIVRRNRSMRIALDGRGLFSGRSVHRRDVERLVVVAESR
jgi:hypothetical protein